MENELVQLTKKKLKTLVTDVAKSAAAVNLTYVTDSEQGIERIRKGKDFIYRLNNKTITDKALLQRIRNLVIPPAWENVWICTSENGHLQATGTDVRGRKQYRYHPHWSQLRNQTKFYHLLEFGKALPAIRLALEKDLSLTGLPKEKVLAAVVSIMQETGVRVGNGAYEKIYGSFGLSTLKDKHAAIKGNNVRFLFKGKKGVQQDISFSSRKLAGIVKNCRDIPGKELFQYYDADGNRHAIDSGMVNNYIKTIAGGHFTAKDFRTWTGTVHALLAFKEMGCANTDKATKHNVVAALDAVSLHLGNTRTVCKKYYVHPTIISMYECRDLQKFLKELDQESAPGVAHGLKREEELLMKIMTTH